MSPAMNLSYGMLDTKLASFTQLLLNKHFPIILTYFKILEREKGHLSLLNLAVLDSIIKVTSSKETAITVTKGDSTRLPLFLV